MFSVRGRTAHLAWYRTDEAEAEVAFLHGFSDSAQCWEPLIREMPGVRALAIDARGHGESGLPDEPIRYEAHRDDAALVLSDQPRDGGVVVVGHSMGAMAAAHLAASRPDLVRAVVLEDPPPGSPGDRLDEPWSEPSWLADLRGLDLPARIAQGRSNDPGWADDELEPWAVSKAQVNPRLFDLTFRDAGPLTGLLAEITCPVLLIHGDTDRGSLISAEYAERCAEAAAGEFRAAQIAGAGHSVRRDNRPAYLAELTAFLDRYR
ncbi:alpha/beta fold hydrolase [Kribbella speibonae]|uniref:Alpha/beta hydrolase n=1 Tax=Kribbella speibonae TaxID=1572660 RepID=A0ABY2ADH1_9ACTN|nr:alpha/beta hydrolase [Kribbella speibonae]TCC27350.1 alpha/beta hydrolase [Kribbella speibonae]